MSAQTKKIEVLTKSFSNVQKVTPEMIEHGADILMKEYLSEGIFMVEESIRRDKGRFIGKQFQIKSLFNGSNPGTFMVKGDAEVVAKDLEYNFLRTPEGKCWMILLKNAMRLKAEEELKKNYSSNIAEIQRDLGQEYKKHTHRSMGREMRSFKQLQRQ